MMRPLHHIPLLLLTAALAACSAADPSAPGPGPTDSTDTQCAPFDRANTEAAETRTASPTPNELSGGVGDAHKPQKFSGGVGALPRPAQGLADAYLDTGLPSPERSSDTDTTTSLPKDPYRPDIPDRHRRWARATALVTSTARIRRPSDDRPRLAANCLQRSHYVCREEPFAHQPTAGTCSAFLVAPNLVVTAGHCLDAATCDDTRFVFDYGYYRRRQDPTRLHPAQIRRCDDIVARRYEGDGPADPDYAVARLSEPVDDRQPLPVRRNGRPAPDTAVAVIGHPSGLPVKIYRARINHRADTHFTTSAHVRDGASGGPAINLRTGRVEGLVSTDFADAYTRDESADCRRKAPCPGTDRCRGSSLLYPDHWRSALE